MCEQETSVPQQLDVDQVKKQCHWKHSSPSPSSSVSSHSRLGCYIRVDESRNGSTLPAQRPPGYCCQVTARQATSCAGPTPRGWGGSEPRPQGHGPGFDPPLRAQPGSWASLFPLRREGGSHHLLLGCHCEQSETHHLTPTARAPHSHWKGQ